MEKPGWTKRFFNKILGIESSSVGVAGDHTAVQGDIHIGDRIFNAPPLKENINLDEEIRSYCEKAESLHQDIQLAGFKTRLRVPIRIEDI